MVAVTVSVFVYLFVKSNLGNQDGDTMVGQTDTSKTQKIEEDNRPKSDYQSPAEAVNELVNIKSVFQRTASLYSISLTSIKAIFSTYFIAPKA